MEEPIEGFTTTKYIHDSLDTQGRKGREPIVSVYDRQNEAGWNRIDAMLGPDSRSDHYTVVVNSCRNAYEPGHDDQTLLKTGQVYDYNPYEGAKCLQSSLDMYNALNGSAEGMLDCGNSTAGCDNPINASIFYKKIDAAIIFELVSDFQLRDDHK